jgi:CelD/BcsL family acetyltransferase involved in cellulose biosynthesis
LSIEWLSPLRQSHDSRCHKTFAAVTRDRRLNESRGVSGRALVAGPQAEPPAPSSAYLTIELFGTVDALRRLRFEWNALLETSAARSIFLTWEWVTTWWEIYGEHRQLHVLTARDSLNRLVGLAPLMRTPVRIVGPWLVEAIQFIGVGGDVTPEYLDLIATSGYEPAVVNAFMRHLCDDRLIQLFDLRPVPAASNMRALVERFLEGQAGGRQCVHEAACPILALPATTEEFLRNNSRNYRKKVGEYERRCNRELEARVRVSETVEDVERDMNVLIDLHRRRWAGQSRAFQSERYLRFHRLLATRLLERGWLRLYTLESGSRSLAALYCFFYGGRYSFYQSGRDPEFSRYRVGIVTMHRVIQEAIREGATVFDFLRGNEEYKYRWASMDVESVRIVYWKSLQGRVGASLPQATWDRPLNPFSTLAVGIRNLLD